MSKLIRLKYLYSSILVLVIFLHGYQCDAQTHTIHGKIYAFKNLELNNIQITSKKSEAVTFTSSDGSFRIHSSLKDKLIFSGNGFERTSKRITNSDSLSVKMIFKGGSSNRSAALCNNHLTKDEINFAIEFLSVYNCYNCPNSIYNSVINKNPRNSEKHLLSSSSLQHSDYKLATITSTNYLNNRW